MTNLVVNAKLTANYERNLEAIEVLSAKPDATLAYNRLMDDLAGTLIPKLERFSAIGRIFLERTVHSVEVMNALGHLKLRLGGKLRAYLFADYLVLNAQFGDVVHLLLIKYHCQFSFNLQSLGSKN